MNKVDLQQMKGCNNAGVNYLTEDLILLHDDEYLAVINKVCDVPVQSFV